MAPETADSLQFQLESPGSAQTDMVHVPAGGVGQMIDFIGWMLYRLPSFDMDRFEVTNRQYQLFVDHGGYSKREYWKETIVKDGKTLAWEQAMDLFRDSTDRSWTRHLGGIGHFPQGQADYPVSGVSWYEAAAYAAFTGKSLPAIAQWYRVAPPSLAKYSITQGNFGGQAIWRNRLSAVGASHEVGPYGTYDMVPDVRKVVPEFLWR